MINYLNNRSTFSCNEVVKTLKKTFVHIPGVGKNTESQILGSVTDWHDFLENNDKVSLRESRKKALCCHVKNSIKAYEDGDYSFFIENLPGNLHWRAYPDMKDRCCFLDIETTGLDKHNDDITIIGLYDGKESKFFIKDQNLEEFREEIKKYNLIVSFNGRCFDIPFIQAKFPDVDFNKFHIDLRFAMSSIGYAGGLKRIEKVVGIKRPDDLEEVDGFEAVRLWYKYKAGDENALDLLLRYNKEDIENLKVLMDFAFERLQSKEGGDDDVHP